MSSAGDRMQVVVTGDDRVTLITAGIQGVPGASLQFRDIEGDPTTVGTSPVLDGTSLYAARRDHKHSLDLDEVAALPINTATQAALNNKQPLNDRLTTIADGGVIGDAQTWPTDVYMPHDSDLRFRTNAGGSDFPVLNVDNSDVTNVRSLGGGIAFSQLGDSGNNYDGLEVARITEGTPTLNMLGHAIVNAIIDGGNA